MHPTQNTTNQTTHSDEGYTLIEMLLIMIIIGVLATIVVMAVVGTAKAGATESACAGEQRQLITASESYFALTRTQSIPATGADNDRFERTLVDNRLLRSVSEMYDVAADGELTAEAGSSC